MPATMIAATSPPPNGGGLRPWVRRERPNGFRSFESFEPFEPFGPFGSFSFRR